MRKFLFILAFVALAGCAGDKRPYHYQSQAAETAAESIQKHLTELGDDVANSCAGDQFQDRFYGLQIDLISLRRQIADITKSADADMEYFKAELRKRNISLIGLIGFIIIAAFYGIRKKI